MAEANAARQRNFTRDKFDALLATLRATNPFVAEWLEEAHTGLAEIFGANPGEVWDNLTFIVYLATLLDTVEQMQIKGVLPVIGRNAFETASHEWEGKLSNVRATIRCERTFATNVSGLNDLYYDYEAILEGLPVKNGGAKAYCDGALAKLLRMRRLSR
jgi:hypothetical protein